MSAVRGAAGAPERLRRRRRMLLWSALPVLLALGLSAKLLSVGHLGGQAAQAFERKDAAAVAQAAGALGWANFLEDHKAPFAAGDALVLGGDYAGARAAFEEALAAAAPPDECKIRVNLVLSIERLGDTRLDAEDRTAAGGLFAEGLAVAETAPEGCFLPANSAGQNQDGQNQDGEGDRLRESEERLQQKSAEAGNQADSPDQTGGDGGEPKPEPGPQQNQLDQLGESSKGAQQERSDGRQRDEFLKDNNDGPGPDRPW